MGRGTAALAAVGKTAQQQSAGAAGWLALDGQGRRGRVLETPPGWNRQSCGAEAPSPGRRRGRHRACRAAYPLPRPRRPCEPKRNLVLAPAKVYRAAQASLQSLPALLTPAKVEGEGTESIPCSGGGAIGSDHQAAYKPEDKALPNLLIKAKALGKAKSSATSVPVQYEPEAQAQEEAEFRPSRDTSN